MVKTAIPLVWLITGTSFVFLFHFADRWLSMRSRTGFGRELAIAALQRGDQVIATARACSFSKLQDLENRGAKVLALDVTAPLEDLHEITKRALAFYGRVDVLVNNAGYLLIGALEESSPQETFDQFNTNVFGALNICRAFLPYMRKRKTGTIVFIGSIAGWGSLANAGLYIATKHAIRGLCSTLHEEISPLGLRSVCVDMGYFRTPFLTEGHCLEAVNRISDYQEMAENSNKALRDANGKQAGDPARGAQVLVDLIHEKDNDGRPSPTSIQLGSDCYSGAKRRCEQALLNLELWRDVSYSTDFPQVDTSGYLPQLQ
ncbi:hypothetical protein V5O48_012277 [Marasmius crinis-equi]|uniref:Short chain dehydrogenase n=1 Tax=Marasmius crinis-equi TaxID=585013 RepID=A0ABR3F380_9AGAR